MGKVRITQEQADAIEKVKRQYLEELKEIRQAYEEDRIEVWSRPLFTLNNEEIQKVLFEGYEIEPEYKVGDWVTHVKGYVSKITKIKEEGNHGFTDYKLTGYALHEERYLNTDKVHFRHATPKEIAEEKQRRFWHDNDREVWELKKGDILSNGFREDLTVAIINNTLINGRQVIFKCDSSDLMSSIKEHYTIVCFAHDRKDIKHD